MNQDRTGESYYMNQQLPHNETLMDPLALLAWYQHIGWARRRARRNAARLQLPMLIVRNFDRGYAAVSENAASRYPLGAFAIVERIEVPQ